MLVLITRYLCLQLPILAAVTNPPGQDSAVPPEPRWAVCGRRGLRGEDRKQMVVFGAWEAVGDFSVERFYCPLEHG